MEIALRASLLDWLSGDPFLGLTLNAIVEEAPSRTALPWLAIAASAAADWGTKDRSGREIRVAVELHCRGDQPGNAAELAAAIEARIASMPYSQDGFELVSITFLRSRAEQRAANTRAVLFEYRFRVLTA